MKDPPNIMQENKLLKRCLCSEKLFQGCAVILKGAFFLSLCLLADLTVVSHLFSKSFKHK